MSESIYFNRKKNYSFNSQFCIDENKVICYQQVILITTGGVARISLRGEGGGGRGESVKIITRSKIYNLCKYDR